LSAKGRIEAAVKIIDSLERELDELDVFVEDRVKELKRKALELAERESREKTSPTKGLYLKELPIITRKYIQKVIGKCGEICISTPTPIVIMRISIIPDRSIRQEQNPFFC